MTSLFLPHPGYAEEQEYSRTILAFHVLRSGFVAGSTTSVLTSSISTLYSRFRYQKPISLSSFGRTALLHSARGTPAGLVLSGVGLMVQMRGAEEYGWQDRSWRLLENKGQVECDWWILGGAAIGAVAAPAMLQRSAGDLAAKTVAQGIRSMGTSSAAIGGAGLGSFAGMMVYLARPGSPSRK